MPLRLLPLIVATLLLNGCAASGLFSPYPQQALTFRAALTATPGAGGTGDPVTVLKKLDNRRTTADATLYLMERGRIEQLQGDFAASKADFEEVLSRMDAADDKARLTASGATAFAASMVSNDNALPYKAPPYERTLVHLYQVFNYLALRDLEGANVELRRAQLVQRQMELKHDKEIAEQQERAKNNDVDVDKYDQYFAGMDTLAGKVKNAFQNGYAFYTAAVIEEAQGEYNDAMVDFKKTLEMSPQNSSLRDDVIRLNRYFSGSRLPPRTGVVVVLYEQDLVPEKSPVGLSIPTANGSVTTIQVPIYSGSDYVAPRPLGLRYGTTSTQTFPLADNGALAAKTQREKMVGILVRQVLRARAKYEMQKQAADQGGAFAQLAANLYNTISEQADLRSWLTLPAHGQGFRLEMPAGQQTLELVTGTGSTPVQLDVTAGKTIIVRAIEVNGRLLTQVYPL